MQPAESRTGSIYDLGYRHYDGARLGRRQAILSLYLFTLRGAFGLGRRSSAKIVPIIITIIAFLPAIAQLGIAALVADDVDVITPQGYFGFIEVPIALFCAAIAPEITGRDMRQRTLSLYFSRALQRRDYALAKLAAFTTAMLVLTLMPQVILVFGNGLATNDLGNYINENWADLPRTFASGVLIAAATASFSLAIAAQTSRRAYATVAVVAWYLVTFPITAMLVQEVGGAARAAIFLSPFDFIHGSTVFVFDGSLEFGTSLDRSGFPLWTFMAAVIAYTAAGVALVIRRFERIAA